MFITSIFSQKLSPKISLTLNVNLFFDSVSDNSFELLENVLVDNKDYFIKSCFFVIMNGNSSMMTSPFGFILKCQLFDSFSKSEADSQYLCITFLLYRIFVIHNICFNFYYSIFFTFLAFELFSQYTSNALPFYYIVP